MWYAAKSHNFRLPTVNFNLLNAQLITPRTVTADKLDFGYSNNILAQ